MPLQTCSIELRSGEYDGSDTIVTACILVVSIYEAFALFVPWRIAHDDVQMLPIRNLVFRDAMADACYGCFIVKPVGLCYKQFTVSGTTNPLQAMDFITLLVCCLWHKLLGYCGFRHKMYLILVNNDDIIALGQFV